MITFNFQIDPVAKGRPRLGRGRTYTPQRTKDFENRIKSMAQQQYRNGPMKGALSVTVVFFIKKPASVTRDYPTVKPDLDNLEKSLFDALNGIAYEDDSQIIELSASKKYGEIGGIFVDIRPYLQKVF